MLLPVGYERTLDEKVVMVSDESVRSAIFNIFNLFKQIHSIRGILLYLKRKGLELPYRTYIRGIGRKIGWRKPSYDAIYALITNPTYTGAYIYGKRRRQTDPIQKKTVTRSICAKEWEVFIPAHHEGYITYEEYEENQRILKGNSYKEAMSKGAPREGEALLQGIVYCKKCGLKMRVRYTQRKPYYCCDRDNRRFGEPICNWASAGRVDGAFEELFLSVLNSATVDLSIKFALKQREETARLKKYWDQKLQRHEYEATLARRRYEAVDPENRLVAATLEREWNEKLEIFENIKADYSKQFGSEKQLELNIGEIKQQVNELPVRWFDSSICMQEKKEIVRTLVENVFLDKREKTIKVEVNWYGGATTEILVPKYIFTSAHIYHRIKKLALQKTDKQIAERLNDEGLQTVKGRDWTTRRVMDFRLSNGIASSFTTSKKMRIPNSGFVSSGELAQNLKVNKTTIQKWFNAGILEGHKDGGRAKLWIRVNDKTIKRLDGTAPIDSSCVSMERLMMERKAGATEIVAWAKNEGNEILRVRRGSTYRFYIRPKIGSEISP